MASSRALVAVLLLGLGACGGGDNPAPSTKRTGIPLGDAPQKGPAEAWVTIVEYGDFQCPACGIEKPVLDQLLAAYPTDVRLVWKHFPLTQIHVNALRAAVAAECAHEQGKFWELYDLLFAHQTALTDPELASYGAQVAGLDTSTYEACRSDPAGPAVQQVQADVAQGNLYRVPGTPTLFVNGIEYPGAYAVDVLKKAVDAEIAAAQASGVPRADYYAKVVLGGG